MPVMNGIESTSIIRSRGYTVPVIAVTGNALQEDQAAFQAAGANHVLTKVNRERKRVNYSSKIDHIYLLMNERRLMNS